MKEPAIDPATRKEQIFEAIRGTPSPTRRARWVRAAILLSLAAAGTMAIFLYAGGLRASPRPANLIGETALGAFCIAALALFGVFGRGGTTLGRSRRALLLLIAAIPVSLFAWKVYWSAGHLDMMEKWPTRPGLRCLGLSLLMGLGPLLALVFLRRDSDPVHPSLTGGALGVATGACVWVLVDLWCPVAYVPHLLLGHLLPLVLFGVLGALLGGWQIALRER